MDDYLGFAIAYSVKSKDEADESLKTYLVSARNLLGKYEKICYIRSDQGTEFTGRKFLEILREKKIETELSPPYTREHNRVAERFNKTIQEKVRAYMFDSGLPKSMWVLAVNAAAHVYNRMHSQNYWDLSNEHMTSGGRKFYCDKGKVVS